MLKYQQERNHSVLPGILCAWPENCLNYELLVTKESKLCSLKRVSFIAWYFNHFVDSNTKLTYGRIALFVRWPASVQPLGSEGLKQLPIHVYGSFARKLQNWTDYFQMEKKKTHTKSTTYLDKFGLTIKISSEEDNFSLIVTKTLWIAIHSHLAIKGENCHSTKLRE